jgi:hypothetical protein
VASLPSFVQVRPNNPDDQDQVRNAMLRKILLAACAALVLPADMSAQSIGVGVAARAGTLGFGGEAAVNVTRFLGVRGGFGVLPFKYTGAADQVTYRIESTSPISNIGVDLYPGLADLRIGGGIMFLPNPTTFQARYDGTIMIDGAEYSNEEIGDLTGSLDHGSSAPYLIIGLGRQTNRGIGIFLDLGAGFIEGHRFSYSVTGAVSDPSNPRYDEFQQGIAAETQAIEDNANKYVKVFPILSGGIRFGIR